MNVLVQDFRYGLRQLRKSPGFTAVAVLTLALGIGANTAVFSVVNAVLLRALPVRDPGRLYYVQIANGNQPPRASNTGNSNTSFSEPVFEALRQRHDIFADLVAYAPLGIPKTAVRFGDTPEEAEGEEVSGSFFSGLTAGIVRGRAFTLDDERNHAPVAVISYDYWTRRFAQDSSVLGETLFVKNVPLTVIGIAAPGFRGIEPAISTDFWVPLQNRAELNAWGNSADINTLYGTPKWWCLPMMARLRKGVTPQQAQNALQSTFGEAAKIGIGDIDPKQWKPLLSFDPARGIQGYNQQYREEVQVLMGLVLLVLLIACTNVALLLVARNEVRQREFSLKLAIGAEKLDLFRQLLVESSLLVTSGATLGWIFAAFATRALAGWSGIESGLDPDRNVLLFTLGTSTLVAIGFGLAPLWIALRSPVSGVLRANSFGLTAGRRRAIAARLLMASQIAVCLLLLFAAGLLLRTLRKYQTESLGMNTDGLLVFGVTPQHANSTAETSAFYRDLLHRTRALPGVEGATLVENRPGGGWSDNNDVELDGVNLTDKYGPRGIIRSNDVGPNFFGVLGVPLLQGRDISESDTQTSPPVAVVNETFVKLFLPNANALGHKLYDGTPSGRTIVGVVKDSKYTRVWDPATPMAYYPIFQAVRSGETLQVELRSAGNPLGLLPTITKTVHEIDPDIPLQKPTTQQAQFEESFSEPTMFARMGGFFGGLAALLVATGLYGTLSYRINRRTTDIGMRMALGAQREQVLRMIMRESLLITAIGVAAGLPLALGCARFLDSMLYQLSPFDPLSFALAMCSVALVGGAAALVPSWRAAKVDPMVALRYE